MRVGLRGDSTDAQNAKYEARPLSAQSQRDPYSESTVHGSSCAAEPFAATKQYLYCGYGTCLPFMGGAPVGPRRLVAPLQTTLPWRSHSCAAFAWVRLPPGTAPSSLGLRQATRLRPPRKGDTRPGRSRGRRTTPATLHKGVGGRGHQQQGLSLIHI